MAIPFAVGFLTILLIFGGSLFYVSRHNLHTSVYYASKEQAYFLAELGLELGKDKFQQVVDFLNDPDPATLPKRDNAPTEIRSIVEAFLDTNGFPIKTGVEYVEPLNNWQDFLKSGMDEEWHFPSPPMNAPALKLSFTLSEASPLYTGAGLPIKNDPDENNFLISVCSEAEIQGSPTKVVLFKELRFVNIIPSIMGKFPLFMRTNRSAMQLNSIEDSKIITRIEEYPIIIKNREEASVFSMKPPTANDFFDRQGWIFLGGGSWDINVNTIGEDERYKNSPIYPNVNLKLLNPGLWPDLYTFSQQIGLHRELATEDYRMALQELEFEIKYSSRLNLMGTKKEYYPTVVIGAASRVWALLQGLFLKRQHYFFYMPFSEDSGSYTNTAAPLPGNIIGPEKTGLLTFFPSYTEYKNRMSQLLREPLNYANLAALDFNNHDYNSRIAKEPGSAPGGLPTPMNRLETSAGKANFFEPVNDLTTKILDDNGQLLYQGDLSMEKYMTWLSPRRGKIYTNMADFAAKHLESNVLSISGIVEIRGDLNIDEPVNIAPGGGGIIIVKGNVNIRKGIYSNGELLTIIAYKGADNARIAISTPEDIEAGLIALQGTIALPRKFRIYGFLAADELDFGIIKSKDERTIRYNPDFDPTEKNNRMLYYRIMTEQRWRKFVQ